MKRNWWKFLCILLLAFTFFAGIITPLAPGFLITSNTILPTYSAPFTVKILGYNTRFKENEKSFSAWLTNWDDKQAVNTCPDNVMIIDDNHAELTFPPTSRLDSMFFGISVYNDADGKMYTHSAIFTSDTMHGGLVQSCKPVVKNAKADHFSFPFRDILYESMRNLFFHVPMWFAMIALLTWAIWNNFKYLRGFDLKYDARANQAVNTALLFGMLGLITGSLWARATWGAWWVDDVKLNGTAITMLAYLAYFVLRNSLDDEQKRARVTAIYSIFAYVMMIVLIGILPRLQSSDSLHPGNGGNPAFSNYDLDNSLRPIFYSAVLGWILLSFWIYSLRLRITALQEKNTEA
ncbi:MAG: cytochrome c biogenesis protein CcsA [Bacteroidia bacterium]